MSQKDVITAIIMFFSYEFSMPATTLPYFYFTVMYSRLP